MNLRYYVLKTLRLMLMATHFNHVKLSKTLDCFRNSSLRQARLVLGKVTVCEQHLTLNLCSFFYLLIATKFLTAGYEEIRVLLRDRTEKF